MNSPADRTTLYASGRLLVAVVLAVGAALTLTFAPAQEIDGDPVVLRLGSQTERLSELDARFEIAIRSLAANQGITLDEATRAQLESFKPQFLEQRATELVLVGEGRRRAISVSDEDVEAVVERIRGNTGEGEGFDALLEQAGFRDEMQLRELIRENELINRTVTALREAIEISEDQLKVAYAVNKSALTRDAQVCARHILLESEQEAQDTVDDLSAGADFVELAMERSTGPSGPNGGDLGCFARERMVAPFADAAFGAPVDQPIGPVETQFGFHVILVYEIQPASVTPFDQVREQLEQQIRGELVDQTINALREASGVRLYPERFQPAAESGDDAAGEGN